MTIFLIAFAPAFVVFIISIATGSRPKTTVAALIAAAMGALTGNPAYTLLDVGFVAVAYMISMSMLGKTSAPATTEPIVSKSDSSLGSTIFILGFLGFAAYQVFSSATTSKPPLQPTQLTPQQGQVPVSTRAFAPPTTAPEKWLRLFEQLTPEF